MGFLLNRNGLSWRTRDACYGNRRVDEGIFIRVSGAAIVTPSSKRSCSQSAEFHILEEMDTVFRNKDEMTGDDCSGTRPRRDCVDF